MFIDEFSQIDEAFEVYARTTDTTGCRIFNGTHKGQGTCFYELATSRVATIKKRVVHWTQHPLKNAGAYHYDQPSNKTVPHDLAYQYPGAYVFDRSGKPAGGPFPGVRSPWYDLQCIRKRKQRDVAMDLDIDPGGSVDQFFDALVIKGLIASYCMPPLWEGGITYDRDAAEPLYPSPLVKGRDGMLKLWINPLSDGTPPPARYVGGTDVSAGLGATNSTFTMLRADDGEKVLEMASPNVRPEAWATICVALCKLFRSEQGTPAKLAWEDAGPGQTFGRTVLGIGFSHIHYREAHATLQGGRVSDVPGWRPTPDQKRLLLDEYDNALRSHQFINRSEIALQECLPYRITPTGVEHPSDVLKDVNHGDRVIADALAWMLGKNLRKSARKEKKEEIQVGSLAWRRLLAQNQLRGAY
jgi:hypothetical protein